MIAKDGFPMFVGIVHIFCGDWIDCRGTSPTVLHYNAVQWSEQN